MWSYNAPERSRRPTGTEPYDGTEQVTIRSKKHQAGATPIRTNSNQTTQNHPTEES